MPPKAYVTMLFHPAAIREQATARSAMTAMGIHAVYGMLAFYAVATPMQPMFTVGFVVTATLLFGPLLGFIVSSIYPRVEMTVGRRLGGEAGLDELYRLLAWSFLPAGPALLLVALLLSLLDSTSTAVPWLLALPALILFGCGIRNYASNIIAAQRFTPGRGLIGMVMTCILFVVLMAAGAGLVAILYRLGAGENLLAIYNQL